LRGVNILGIDSVMCPIERRRLAWSRLAKELPLEKLDSTIKTVTLETITDLAPEIIAGKVRGRVVVEI
jgi:acrylyl-CoA reductase (NADPH)